MKTEKILAKYFNKEIKTLSDNLYSDPEETAYYVTFKGQEEKLNVAKAILKAFPELVSFDWIEKNKKFFSEDGENLILKETGKKALTLGLSPLALFSCLAPGFFQHMTASGLRVITAPASEGENLKKIFIEN